MRVLAVVLLGVVVTASDAAAAQITALRLPAGFTVPPESERRLVAIGPDGTVVAAAQAPNHVPLAVRWSANGSRSELAASVYPGDATLLSIDGVVAAREGVYVTSSQTGDGSTIHTEFATVLWSRNRTVAWNHGRCKAGENTSFHVTDADASGRLAVTADDTGVVLPQETDDGYADAPVALVADASGCRRRGNAVMLGVRGAWASGYRGYLGRFVAPTIVNAIVQRAVAVRWHGEALDELGDGVAYAVNAKGFAVGATAVAGRFETVYGNMVGPAGRYMSAVPHAVVWDTSGRRSAIGGDAERSVAYDVANDGTVVGMLQARDGKHYAFRRRMGRLERLDDLPHPRGWRFESAYAIASDGTIVGVGTLDGHATVFRWQP